MHTDDFFHTRPDEAVDWSEFRSGEWACQLWELNVELMESLRFGALPAHSDLDVAVALTRLLHEDFVVEVHVLLHGRAAARFRTAPTTAWRMALPVASSLSTESAVSGTPGQGAVPAWADSTQQREVLI
ncbi:hypothetical protein [Streptomyces sp. NBC_01594]|uniref:hypothetical protein n=1 Tax=Streptomyces sp. NBC_01594 TaxID=2975890 RepID=UPI00386E72F1